MTEAIAQAQAQKKRERKARRIAAPKPAPAKARPARGRIENSCAKASASVKPDGTDKVSAEGSKKKKTVSH